MCSEYNEDNNKISNYINKSHIKILITKMFNDIANKLKILFVSNLYEIKLVITKKNYFTWLSITQVNCLLDKIFTLLY